MAMPLVVCFQYCWLLVTTEQLGDLLPHLILFFFFFVYHRDASPWLDALSQYVAT
jgi:hypothetical protein